MEIKNYREIGKLKVEGIEYPVFFSSYGITYYLKGGTYLFVDWNFAG